MDNDNKIKATDKTEIKKINNSADKIEDTAAVQNASENSAEEKPKARKPRKSAEQKAKESVLAAVEEVLTEKKEVEKPAAENNLPAVSRQENNEVHKQVTVLLENELTRISSDDVKKSFDMEAEYAKAKKNSLRFAWKNMWSRLFLCVLVVVAITIILTIIVNINNRRIPVNVKGFDNVKLDELLNDVDKIDSQITENENKKAEYEARRSEEIQKVEDTYSSEKEKIESTYTQEKKKAEKNYSSESKKLDSKKTTGWLETRNKNKDIEKNKNKYDEALSAANKKREDALAISRNKYKRDLSQAKNLYKTEIDNCWNTINKLKEDRYRFDNNKVQLEAEYDGKLKDKDILHKREMDDQKTEFDEKFLQQKTEYENLLAAANKKLEDTVAADLERENKKVAETISSYDPEQLKDTRAKKIVKSANGIEYNVGTEERISYLPKEGSSDLFKKTLETQKSYYDDISYLASLYEQFPQKKDGAINSYVQAIKSVASKAGNEIYASSVNEVNRIIEEKNNIDYERKTAVEERDILKSDLTEILETMCQEKPGEINTGAVVASVSQNVYTVYVGKDRRAYFTDSVNKGKVFPCSVYRSGRKVASARIDSKNKEKYVLTNVVIIGSKAIRPGDRIVLEEPYTPK